MSGGGGGARLQAELGRVGTRNVQRFFLVVNIFGEIRQALW